MRGGEEFVMAVRTDELFDGAAPQGLCSGGRRWLDFIFDPRNSRFLPRPQAENDPSWKQIIPYVVLYHCDQVFCYRRGRASTESRLVAQHSIGLGGHIRPADESLFAAAGWPAYQSAMRRELAEEVELPADNPRSDRLVAVLNDDSTEVGRVHVGLVHLWELHAPIARSRESKIAGGRFVALSKLAAPDAEPLESWSKFCVEGWSGLLAQRGWSQEH